MLTMFYQILILLSVSTYQMTAVEEFPEPVDYSRHKVLRVLPANDQQLNFITRLGSSPQYWPGVKLWNEPMLAGGALDMHVSPSIYSSITELLESNNIQYTVLIEDLQRLIAEQKAEIDRYKRKKRQRGLARSRTRRQADLQDSFESDQNSSVSERISRFGTEDQQESSAELDEITEADIKSIIDNFASYDEIVDWLQLVRQYKSEIVQLEILTRSYEGLPLYLIQIGKPRTDGKEKPALWIDAGIHAREWISPATAIYFIYSLISGYANDSVVTGLIEDFDWFILPLLNPDGYEYTRTTDRMWRKTRSRIKSSLCFGVDANRNFDFQWKSDCKPRRYCRGRNPCDDVFAGRQPFSEPETIGLANWIMANKQRLKLYISLHSYSQLWLVPWGYTSVQPVDYYDLFKNARKAVSALKSVNNTAYRIGSPADILYVATGGSYDWVKGVAGIKYSYTIELRDTGTNGFLLPRSQIEPTGRETWAGLVQLVEEIKKDSCWMNPQSCTRVNTEQ